MSPPRHPVSFDQENRPWSEKFGDHFFSTSGGRAETDHVFLGGNGLPERWRDVERFTVGELGFGCGLNFLQTWHRWCETRRGGQHLEFVSFEAHPLEFSDIARAFSIWPDLADLCTVLQDQRSNPTASVRQADDQTSLQIIHADALAGMKKWNGRADAWFLDGFSPSKNPDMWSAALMHEVFRHTKPGGTFATYTAAGWVRKNLRNAGFAVETAAGFGAKREMTKGFRPL